MFYHIWVGWFSWRWSFIFTFKNSSFVWLNLSSHFEIWRWSFIFTFKNQFIFHLINKDISIIKSSFLFIFSILNCKSCIDSSFVWLNPPPSHFEIWRGSFIFTFKNWFIFLLINKDISTIKSSFLFLFAILNCESCIDFSFVWLNLLLWNFVSQTSRQNNIFSDCTMYVTASSTNYLFLCVVCMQHVGGTILW